MTTIYPYLKYNYLPPVVSISTIGTSRQSVKTRTLFLFVQYSITLLLIILSLYFSNHLHFLLNTPPGFRTEGILYADLMPKLPNQWWEDSQEIQNKRWHDREVMEQKLNECPYIEHWFAGDTGREGILSAGSMSSMINDKGGKLNMAMMWVTVDFFKLYGLHIVDGSLPDEVNGHADYLVAMNKAALKAFWLYPSGRCIRQR
ncbi:hypothetical protein NXV33_02615 [Bacteroides thetaiotaomicron]|nr:hypothetical protein [Bacteroides thetaiotaomicron]